MVVGASRSLHCSGPGSMSWRAGGAKTRAIDSIGAAGGAECLLQHLACEFVVQVQHNSESVGPMATAAVGRAVGSCRCAYCAPLIPHRRCLSSRQLWKSNLVEHHAGLYLTNATNTGCSSCDLLICVYDKVVKPLGTHCMWIVSIVSRLLH